MNQIEAGWFWCSRCGTVRHGQSIYTPHLIERCREFEGTFEYMPEAWDRLGIRDAITGID
jgi:hypothetical protein